MITNDYPFQVMSGSLKEGGGMVLFPFLASKKVILLLIFLFECESGQVRLYQVYPNCCQYLVAILRELTVRNLHCREKRYIRRSSLYYAEAMLDYFLRGVGWGGLIQFMNLLSMTLVKLL